MKKTLHWINIIICFLLLGLGIIMVVYGGSSAEINTDTGIFRLMGIVQILMAILVWFIGAVLPEEGKYPSKRMQKVLKIILILAIIGNDKPVNMGAFDVANGKVKVQRFWEPTLIFVWAPVEIFVLSFFSLPGGLLGAAVIVSYILMVSLFCTSFAWKWIIYKEKGILNWTNMLLPIIVILVIFVIIGAVTAFYSHKSKSELNEKLDILNENLQQQEEQGWDVNNPNNASESGDQSYQDLNTAQISQLISEDMQGDVYYRWIEGDDNTVNVVVWSSEQEDVYVYQFVEDGEAYDFNGAFVSESLDKADVEGKESGVLKAQ